MHSDREKLVEKLREAQEAMRYVFMTCPVPNAVDQRRAWGSLCDAIQSADAALARPAPVPAEAVAAPALDVAGDNPIAEVKALREALLACRERAETGGLRIETAMDACEDISEIVACALPPEGWQAASPAVQGGDHGE